MTRISVAKVFGEVSSKIQCFVRPKPLWCGHELPDKECLSALAWVKDGHNEIYLRMSDCMLSNQYFVPSNSCDLSVSGCLVAGVV